MGVIVKTSIFSSVQFPVSLISLHYPKTLPLGLSACVCMVQSFRFTVTLIRTKQLLRMNDDDFLYCSAVESDLFKRYLNLVNVCNVGCFCHLTVEFSILNWFSI